MTAPDPREGSAGQVPAESPAPAPQESANVPAWGAAYALTPEAYAAEPAAEQPNAIGRGWLAFRRWRRSRPFWGGLLITLGGAEILFSEKAPLGVVLHIGLQGLAGYLLPAVMVLCGLLLWFSPAQRAFYGVLSVLLSLGTWLTSNLGGFIVGMLLGLVGGSLAFGWSPRRPAPAAQAPAAGPRNPAPNGPDPTGTTPSTVS